MVTYVRVPLVIHSDTNPEMILCVDYTHHANKTQPISKQAHLRDEDTGLVREGGKDARRRCSLSIVMK